MHVSSDYIACYQDAFFTYDPAAGFWSRVPGTDIKARALDVLKRLSETKKSGKTEFESFCFGSARHVDDTTRLLRTVSGEGPLNREASPHAIPFTTGTYCTKTCKEISHSPDHGATYAITGPFSPDASAPPPELQAVITTSFPEGAEHIIRTYFRWLIDPTVPFGHTFHFVGATGTDKGLMIDTGIALLPPRSVSSLKHPALLKDADEAGPALPALTPPPRQTQSRRCSAIPPSHRRCW